MLMDFPHAERFVLHSLWVAKGSSLCQVDWVGEILWFLNVLESALRLMELVADSTWF